MPVPRVIRIFVASPGDVAREREILDRVIRDLNDTLQNSGAKVKLELLRWETHVRPGAKRPQAEIFRQIGDDYDVLIAMMWRRFGTPTGMALSGTEEECRRAYRRWQRTGKPEIMFYFSSAAAPPPTEVREARQLLRVVQFRQEIQHQQLIADYDGPAGFEEKVRHHLNAVIGSYNLKLKKPARGPKRSKVEAITQAAVLSDMKREMRKAATAKKPAKDNGKTPKQRTRLSRDQVAAVKKLVKHLIRDLENPRRPRHGATRRRKAANPHIGQADAAKPIALRP